MYSSANLSTLSNLPNLPGLVPSHDSWIHRQSNGFKRTSRPNSAVNTMSRGLLNITSFSSNSIQDEPQSNQESIESRKVFIRPASAGFQRSKSNMLSTVSSDILPSELHATQRYSRPNQSARSTREHQSSRSILSNIGASSGSIALNGTISTVPRYVETEKIVCRFYGYFFEERVWATDTPLGTPDIEKEITRKLTIYYYVQDNTVAMTEAVVNNSGLAGGGFYRRAPLFKADGDQLSLPDMAPGNSIHVLGREIFINDCDAFTRDYFRKELDLVLSPALNEPAAMREDIGALYATGFVSTVPLQKTSHASQSFSYSQGLDAKDRMTRYFKFDGKVFRFLCVDIKDLDDMNDMHITGSSYQTSNHDIGVPERAKKYALSYFLADRSIDIRCVKNSSGLTSSTKNLEEGMLVMKRSKIAKNWRELQSSGGNSRCEAQYYEPEELQCGGVIDVYGRGFLLINCDNYTRAVYRDIDIEQIEVPLVQVKEKTIIHPIPKLGDGFIAIGSEEDTLATIYGMPKVTRDIRKAYKNQHRILRCKLKMCTHDIIDATRNFMLTFYLEDDTIFIYEDAGRNSGMMGGTFLKRGKYKNNLPYDDDKPRYFLPTDIYLGNVISFNGNDMKIIEMDNLSLKFCETYPDEFPFYDAYHIVSKLVDDVKSHHIDLRILFMNMAASNKEVVSKEVVMKILHDVNIINNINDQEILTLLRRIQDHDSSSSNIYYYHELCDLFSYYGGMKTVAQRIMSEEKITSPRSVSDMKTLFKLARLRHTQWRRMIRKDTRSLSGLIALEVIVMMFRKHGYDMSDTCIHQLSDAYAMSSLVAVAFHKQLASSSLSSSTSSSALYDGTSTMRGRGIAAATLPTPYQRLGDTRREETIDFIPSSSSSLLPAMKAKHSNNNLSIAQRREYLLKSNKPTDSRSGAGDHHSDKMIVVDYVKLCNDIYICDWA